MTRSQYLTCFFFCLLLALIPVAAVFAQRSASFIPALAGLVGCLSVTLAFHARLKAPFIALGATISICVLAMLSSFWAINPSEALRMSGRGTIVIMSGVLLLAAAKSIDLQGVRKSLWLVPAAILVASLMIVIEQKGGNPLYRLTHGDLPSGTYVARAEYNRAASIIFLLLIPCMTIFGQYINRKTILALLAVTVLPLFVITDSQSAQLAFITSFIIWVAFPYAHKFVWYGLAGLLFVLALAAPFLSIWMFNHLAQGMNGISVMGVMVMGVDGANSGARLEIWDYISRYALQKPLTGFGLEATRMVPRFDSAEVYQKGARILHPHNFMLQIWMEFGVIGALLTASLLSGLVVYMQRTLNYAQARIALPAMIACLSVASTGYGVWQGWWIGTLFTVSAICILAIRLDRDKLPPVTT